MGIGQRVESKQIEIEYGKKLIMTQKLNNFLENDNSTCLPSQIYLAITLYNEPIITRKSAFFGLDMGQAYLELALSDPYYPSSIKKKLLHMNELITEVGNELDSHKNWDTVDTPEIITFVKSLKNFKESDIFNKKYQTEGLLETSAKIISQQTGESIDIVKIKYFPNAEKYQFIPKGSTWNYHGLNDVNKTYTKFYDNKTFIREIFDD